MTIHLTWTRIDVDGEMGEATFSLPMTIGRSPDNDLMIDSFGSGLSRIHAEIDLEHGTPVLRDLGSTNGVYSERKRISRLFLTNGQPFLLGNVLFVAEQRVQCRKESCQRLVSSSEVMCPWCGQFLADAMTSVESWSVFQLFGEEMLGAQC